MPSFSSNGLWSVLCQCSCSTLYGCAPIASAASCESDITGSPTFFPWALAANWLWSRVVTQPLSWVIRMSGSASSFITSILRCTANEREKSRDTRMWRKPKPQQSNQVE